MPKATPAPSGPDGWKLVAVPLLARFLRGGMRYYPDGPGKDAKPIRIVSIAPCAPHSAHIHVNRHHCHDSRAVVYIAERHNVDTGEIHTIWDRAGRGSDIVPPEAYDETGEVLAANLAAERNVTA